MADVLSQAEVNALLVALEPVFQSNVPESCHHDAALNPGRQHAGSIGLERISTEQVQFLAALLERFRDEFATALSQKLNTAVEIELTGHDRLFFCDFECNLKKPRHLQRMQSKQLDGQVVFALDHSILFTIIDRFLGGDLKADDAPPHGEVTEIEFVIVSIVTSLAIASLQNAFREVFDLQLRLEKIESDTEPVCCIADDEPVLSFGYEIRIGDRRGPLNVCMSASALTSLDEKLIANASSRLQSSNDTASFSPPSQEAAVRETSVEMIVNLAETKLASSEVNNLAIGDVIVTDSKASDGVEMVVAGRGRFRAIPGVVAGQKAVQIEKQITAQRDDSG